MVQQVYSVPLLNTPQRFNITLGARAYTVVSRWNSANEGGWLLDFYDEATELPVVMNVPLVTGTDLFGQYDYLDMGGPLLVYTDGDADAVPTLDNLGVESGVYFLADDGQPA